MHGFSEIIESMWKRDFKTWYIANLCTVFWNSVELLMGL